MLRLVIYLLCMGLVTTNCGGRYFSQFKKEKKLSKTSVFIADSSLFKENIHGWEQPQLDFFYNDLFGMEQNQAYVRQNEQSNIFINRPTVIWFTKISTPFLLYPKDNVLVKQNEEDGSISFIRKSSTKRNNEADFFGYINELNRNIDQSMFFILYDRESQKTSFSSDAISLLMNQTHQGNTKLLRAIDSLGTTLKVRKNFKKIMVQYFIKDSLSQIIDTYFTFKKDSLIPHALFKKWGKKAVSSLSSIKSLKELSMHYDMIRELLWLLVYEEGVDRRVNNEENFKINFDIIVNNFNGLAKEYLLTYIMKSAINNSLNISPDYLQAYDKQCRNKNFKKYIKDNIKQYAKNRETDVLDNGKNLLTLDEKTYSSMEDIIATNTGKLIVFDFWASWCAPCRDENPYSKLLKQQYEGQPVAFVYISLDKEIQKWRKASKAEGINDQNSYLLLSGGQSSFGKLHQIETIPRYMIFGKNGSLLEANAPYPSNSELKILIDKYLSASGKIP